MARHRRITPPRPEAALDAARRNRAELLGAMGSLEASLAAPAPGRAEEWLGAVGAALAEVHAEFVEHVVRTEEPGGFLAEMVEAAPRLATSAEALRVEHGEIIAQLARAAARLDDAPAEPDPAWVDATRDELTELLWTLMRHRQRGADLVYEAFDVDVGGSE